MSNYYPRTGQGGKTLNDRVQSARVRSKELKCIEAVLDDKPEVSNWSDYKKEIVSRLSGSILPRLNEHSGPDGEPIPLLNYVRNNNGNRKNKETEKEDTRN